MKQGVTQVQAHKVPVRAKWLLSILLWIVVSLFSGCVATVSPTKTPPLPTLFPTATPPILDLENAERIANTFLTAWQSQDYTTMHSMTTFASREATPLTVFQQTYDDAHSVMTLESLSYQGRTIDRDDFNNRVAFFTYDVKFVTRLVGEFSDTGRTLRLIYDDQSRDWRVAWSTGDIFKEMENGGRLRLETTPVNRANVYDRNNVVLASQDETLVVTVNIVRREVPDAEACLNALVNASNVSAEILNTRFYNFAADWVNEIATIEPQAFVEWQDTLIQDCNATFGNRPARRYHNSTIAPHILGTVGYLDGTSLEAVLPYGFTQDSILGKSGIEQSWDEVLRGQPGVRLRIDVPGTQGSRVIASREPEVAQSVWLTLDTDLQQHILKLFSDAYNANREGWAQTSKGAAAVVLEINTGRILALVTWPTYDANALAPFPVMGREAAQDIVADLQTDQRQPLLNRAIQGLYPTGSVMKIATSIAVANSGVYGIEQRYTCNGSGTFNRDIPRFDWLASGHGTLNLAGAITQSCNPYFYEAGYQMDITDPWILPTYIRRLGLGVPTGLTDLIEDPGNIGDPDWKRVNRGIPWTFSDAVDMAIGQGMVQVTPLQVARMVATVASGGKQYKPYLVEKAGLLNEISYQAEPELLETVDIRKDVLDVIRSGMCDVTTVQAGTAEYVFRDSPLQEIGVCGKTGTAEDTPRISHAWFASYAPRQNPEIAVVVIVENSGEGSGVAAPIVKSILEYYFFDQDGLALND